MYTKTCTEMCTQICNVAWNGVAWSGVVWCGVARCGAVRSGVVPVAGGGRRWVFGGFLVGVGVLSAGGRAITF